QDVARTGTAARAQATLKRPDLHGKTGTTNDSLDAWFVGYAPRNVAAVWVGYDQPRKLGARETGGGLALPVWIDFMRTALKDVPVTELPVPEGLVQVGGEWYYEEYTPSTSVRQLAPEPGEAPATPNPASEPTSTEERRSILDLF